MSRQRYEDAKDYVDDINYVGPQADIDKAYRNLQIAYDELQRAEAKRNNIGNTNTTAYRIADFQYRDAYNNYAIKLGDYNYLTGKSVDEIERNIAEADLAVAQQQLADAEAELERLQAGPDVEDVAGGRSPCGSRPGRPGFCHDHEPLRRDSHSGGCQVWRHCPARGRGFSGR